MMLGSKGILTPMIPDCSVLRTLTILKNIHNPLIFLRKMAPYSCFWRVPRSKILSQASLHRISDLLTLVSYLLLYKHWKPLILQCFFKISSLAKTLLYFKTGTKTAVKPINSGLTAVFYFCNCQRRDYIMIPRAWKQQVFRADFQPLGYTGRAGI